jgi:hypothetical protein
MGVLLQASLIDSGRQSPPQRIIRQKATTPGTLGSLVPRGLRVSSNAAAPISSNSRLCPPIASWERIQTDIELAWACLL